MTTRREDALQGAQHREGATCEMEGSHGEGHWPVRLHFSESSEHNIPADLEGHTPFYKWRAGARTTPDRRFSSHTPHHCEVGRLSRLCPSELRGAVPALPAPTVPPSWLMVELCFNPEVVFVPRGRGAAPLSLPTQSLREGRLFVTE